MDLPPQQLIIKAAWQQTAWSSSLSLNGAARQALHDCPQVVDSESPAIGLGSELGRDARVSSRKLKLSIKSPPIHVEYEKKIKKIKRKNRLFNLMEVMAQSWHFEPVTMWWRQNWEVLKHKLLTRLKINYFWIQRHILGFLVYPFCLFIMMFVCFLHSYVFCISCTNKLAWIKFWLVFCLAEK